MKNNTIWMTDRQMPPHCPKCRIRPIGNITRRWQVTYRRCCAKSKTEMQAARRGAERHKFSCKMARCQQPSLWFRRGVKAHFSESLLFNERHPRTWPGAPGMLREADASFSSRARRIFNDSSIAGRPKRPRDDERIRPRLNHQNAVGLDTTADETLLPVRMQVSPDYSARPENISVILDTKQKQNRDRTVEQSIFFQT